MMLIKLSACTRMELDQSIFLILKKQRNSKWIKDLNLKLKMVKLLGENTVNAL